jgi:hypothetical protein
MSYVQFGSFDRVSNREIKEIIVSKEGVSGSGIDPVRKTGFVSNEDPGRQG